MKNLQVSFRKQCLDDLRQGKYSDALRIFEKIDDKYSSICDQVGRDESLALISYELLQTQEDITYTDLLNCRYLMNLLRENEHKELQKSRVSVYADNLFTCMVNAYCIQELNDKSKIESVIKDIYLNNKKSIEQLNDTVFDKLDSKWVKKVSEILTQEIENKIIDETINIESLNQTFVNDSIVTFKRYVVLQDYGIKLRDDLRKQLTTLIQEKCQLNERQSKSLAIKIVDNAACLDFNNSLYPLLSITDSKIYDSSVSVKAYLNDNKIEVLKEETNKIICAQMSIAELCLDSKIGVKSTKLLKRLKAVTELNTLLSEEFIITNKVKKQVDATMKTCHANSPTWSEYKLLNFIHAIIYPIGVKLKLFSKAPEAPENNFEKKSNELFQEVRRLKL
jgi:hypothetical protein